MGIKSLDASSFVASIGVNVSLDFFDTPYVNAEAVATDIKYLGIAKVRDLLPASDAASLAPYAALVAEGVKFDLIAGVGGHGLPGMATVKAELDAFEAKYPGAIASVEGPNEPNIYPFSYAGKSGVAAAVAYEADLYKVVTTDPILKGVAVSNFAFGGVGADTYSLAGNENAFANAGNIHVYPDGNGNGAPQPEILNQQTLASVSTPGEPMVMTEFGYSTYAGSDISQSTQAAFELDGLFDAAVAGLSETYLYELIDTKTGTTGYEDNFGQFQSIATTPKAAAVALHNLTSILADSGTAHSGSTLNWAVSGLTGEGGNTLLLQKSNGASDLAVWDEAPGTHDIVTVNLGATYANVEVFDPTKGPSAVSVLHGVSTVSLDVTGHPLIVQVESGTPPVSPPVPVVPPVPVPPPVPAPPPVPVPVLTSVPTPSATVHVSPGQFTVTIAASNTNIVSTSGSHAYFITGTGDALHATGGTQTVQASNGSNALTTGGGNDSITFGSLSTVDAGGGSNMLYDTGSGSTIVLPQAGKGIDLIHGSVLSNGDVFDLRAMLQVTTWSGASRSDLSDYIQIRTVDSGAGAIISVARTGSFAEGSHDVAHIYGSGALSLNALLLHSVTT